MSGNPFRASLVQRQTPAGPAPSVSFIDADSNTAETPELENDSVLDTSPLPAKTKKSVRIESPTSSPPHPAAQDADDALSQRINPNRRGHTDSPLPVSPAGFSDNFEDIATEDPFVKESETGVTARGATESARKSPRMIEALNSPGGAPANPFSRTLATIEPPGKGSAEGSQVAGQNKSRHTADKPGSTNVRASLDVEGFKNMLMKGISSPHNSSQPSHAAPTPHPIAASVFESSSSTDTSSVSRQSIFEPVQEPHIESPRTSYEMAASDDDERVGLVTEAKKGKKRPPPAPKHRYGKLVTPRAPQTVSFSDFSATQPTAAPTSRSRTNSDLNKPLPPTPPVLSPSAHIISQDSTQDQPDESPSLETKASESSGQSDAPSSQKKQPPPVPIARRQSQLRASTAGNRSRSNSSLTMSSQHSIEYILTSPGATHDPTSPPSSQKAPPPPPPSRRHGASATSNNASSANSSTTELPATANTRRPTVSSNPPSSRRTTFSSPPPSPSPGHTRTSPAHSTKNSIRTVSNESTSMPPPPPPPRRRQSGRSSMDKERPYHPSSSPTESRRASTENKRSSLDGKRRTSVASESSLRYEYAPAADNEQPLYSPKEEAEELHNMPLDEVKMNPSNILDDMEKFQREIDELREKYKQVG